MAATLSLFPAPSVRAPRKEAPAVSEPQLFYDPPYATREEDAFAWALVRSLRSTSGLRHSVQMGQTLHNFVIEMDGRVTAIDIIDGDSHSAEAPAQGLGVDVHYRFSRKDIRERSQDCLYVMALLDPSLFDVHSRVRIRRDSSENLAVELNGDRMAEVTLRYEASEPLVEIDGEWLVLDPDETTRSTLVIRTAR